MVGKTYGVFVLHEFAYSWKNGVRLTPIIIERHKEEKIEARKSEDGDRPERKEEPQPT